MPSGFYHMATTLTGLLLAGQVVAQNPDSMAIIADDFRSSLKETTVAVTPHTNLPHHFNISYTHACPKNKMAAHILVMDVDSNGILSQQHDQILEAAYSHATFEDGKLQLKDSIRADCGESRALRYSGMFEKERSVENIERMISFDEGVEQIRTILMLGALPKQALVAKPE